MTNEIKKWQERFKQEVREATANNQGFTREQAEAKRSSYKSQEIAELRTKVESLSTDAERLDWLSENFFSDQKDDWDERQAPNSIKWKFFGPMGVQGRVRDVIDAAMAKEKAPT